jgi:ABC-type sugar transport system permease subunit
MSKASAPKKNNAMLTIQPYIWLLPSLVLMVTMIVIPIISVFRISFLKWDEAVSLKVLMEFRTI